jgi:hypothetical protein
LDIKALKARRQRPLATAHIRQTEIHTRRTMSRKNIVVFSGGSAANNLVDVFGQLAHDKGWSLS